MKKQLISYLKTIQNILMTLLDCSQVSDRVLWATCCYLTADILNKVLQKCTLSISLQTTWILSKLLNLIGCHGNRNAKFAKNIFWTSSPKGKIAHLSPMCQGQIWQSYCLSNLAILYGHGILNSSFLYWPLLCGGGGGRRGQGGGGMQ